jgi:hypothetical protein
VPAGEGEREVKEPRNIEAIWLKLKESLLPPDASEFQASDMRTAFFCGVGTVLHTSPMVFPDDKPSHDRHTHYMADWLNEFERFLDETEPATHRIFVNEVVQ